LRRVPLDNVKHRDLRVATAHGVQFGDDVRIVAVVPQEFRKLVAEYPILLAKDPRTGRFNFIVLLGLDREENLFLDGACWNAQYVPLNARRGPFMVGRASTGQGETGGTMVVHIDLDSRRIQQASGEALFREDGTQTPYLQCVGSVLAELMAGIDTARSLLGQLEAHDLIEPVQIRGRLADGTEFAPGGLYTIHEQRLHNLSAESIVELHRAGHLEQIYLVIASLQRVADLVSRKNRRLSR